MHKELVEQIRGEISHHISPVIGWLRSDASKGIADTDHKRHDQWLERLDLAAEAIAKLVAVAENHTEAVQRHAEALRVGAYIDTKDRLWSYEGDRWRTMHKDGYPLVKYAENFLAFIESDLKNV